jgi:hypothetical protein
VHKDGVNSALCNEGTTEGRLLDAHRWKRRQSQEATGVCRGVANADAGVNIHAGRDAECG